jgi:hypothetical protein
MQQFALKNSTFEKESFFPINNTGSLYNIPGIVIGRITDDPLTEQASNSFNIVGRGHLGVPTLEWPGDYILLISPSLVRF